MSSSLSGVGGRPLQQGRSVAILLMIVTSLAASSCAERPVGEFTADDCNDGDDNDHDLMTDCDDPDCWVFCPFRGAFQIGDASSSAPPDAGPDAATQPAADSGKPKPMGEDDAGMPPVDAGSEDDGGSSPACECASGETCVDGECKPPASTMIEGTYPLTVVTAPVPLGPSANSCFDYENVGCLARVAPLCDCRFPDTYVVVLLNGTALMKATTTPVQSTTNPVWTNSPKVTIDLKPDSKLTFIAFDSDGFGQDPQIFSCVPSL